MRFNKLAEEQNIEIHHKKSNNKIGMGLRFDRANYTEAIVP
jgi:hypothetical protein